jgi:hypothetical protein
MSDEAIRRVLLEILRVGLLRVRAAAYDGRAEECALEADHLHNVPALLEHLRLEELRYYYTVERPGFIQRTKARVDDLLPLWDELGRLLGASR